VITNSHVMSPLVERNEIISLERAPALRYRGAFIEGWHFIDIPEQHLSCHVLCVFWQITHFCDGGWDAIIRASQFSSATSSLVINAIAASVIRLAVIRLDLLRLPIPVSWIHILRLVVAGLHVIALPIVRLHILGLGIARIRIDVIRPARLVAP
jgi:hypothetical protein